MTLPRALAATVVLTALAAAAAGGLSPASAGTAGRATATVHVKDVDFSPKVLEVRRGTTVTWRFEDEETPHNVRSRGRTTFRGSATKQAGRHVVRFTKPGSYAYVCTIHFNMKARVLVR